MAFPGDMLKRGERIQADLLLLLVAVIWGSAFVAQRVAAQRIGVHYFNGLRFLLAAIFLLLPAWSRLAIWVRAPDRALGGIVLAGLFLFGGTTLQQWGLRYTTAGNAGFITGLYVVFIPLILAFGWRQRLKRTTWGAAICSAIGLYLLSTEGKFIINRGDALVLVGALIWACHVILIGRLVRRIEVLPLAIGQYTVTGMLSLGMSLGFESGTSRSLGDLWWTVAYTGILSVGLGYTLQAVGQKVAPPTDAAILLSSEAVFAALSGWLILDERLSAWQLAGCTMIFVGIILAQINGHAGGDAERIHSGK